MKYVDQCTGDWDATDTELSLSLAIQILLIHVVEKIYSRGGRCMERRNRTRICIAWEDRLNIVTSQSVIHKHWAECQCQSNPYSTVRSSLDTCMKHYVSQVWKMLSVDQLFSTGVRRGFDWHSQLYCACGWREETGKAEDKVLSCCRVSVKPTIRWRQSDFVHNVHQQEHKLGYKCKGANAPRTYTRMSKL